MFFERINSSSDFNFQKRWGPFLVRSPFYRCFQGHRPYAMFSLTFEEFLNFWLVILHQLTSKKVQRGSGMFQADFGCATEICGPKIVQTKDKSCSFLISWSSFLLSYIFFSLKNKHKFQYFAESFPTRWLLEDQTEKKKHFKKPEL